MPLTGRLRARRGGRKESRLPAVAGILLIVVAVGAVAALFWFRPEAVPRDPETMCPEAGPSRVTAILVDTTDRVGALSRADVLGRLQDFVDGSEPDEMIVAYETRPISEAVGEDPLPALVRVCNPGDPDTANPLISSPELIRRRLEERFRQPLERLFTNLFDRTPAPKSPLMENVQAISATLLSRRAVADIGKRLILVSDLLQHSDDLSFYGGLPDYSGFRSGPGAAALMTDLDGVEIEVFFLQRADHDDLGGARAVISFWERWVSDQGGRIERVVRVSAVN